MKRLILSLVPVALIALVSFGSMGGCGSGGGPCEIRFNEFYNGSTQATQDSEWSCVNGGVVVFTIAFFGDGTGTRSDAGAFTWEQTKCRELDFETDSLESGTLSDIEGSEETIGGITIGQLAFNQTSDGLGDISVVCEYVEIVE